MSSLNPKPPKDHNWPKDEFGKSKVFPQFWWLIPLLLLLGSVGLLPSLHTCGKGMARKQVIAYCAQDQVYAQPLFRAFEKETGLKVRAVYDSEAVKTVGLANRLLAERNHPQCDVSGATKKCAPANWRLRASSAPANGWAAFGYRSRRIVINTNLLSLASAPHSLLDLTNIAMARQSCPGHAPIGHHGDPFPCPAPIWGEPRGKPGAGRWPRTNPSSWTAIPWW